jgi:NAD(P) transhydrogenase subunit beta
MEDLAKIFYLAATALFIFGVKDLAKVRTSRRGNGLAALGMLVAVVTTLVAPEGGIQLDWKWVAGGLILGSLLGALLARTIAMTGMPEMVALFNGFGGAASLLVALSVFAGEYMGGDASVPAALTQGLGVDGLGEGAALTWTVAVMLSVLIGAVTLTGSLVAMGKLSGKIPGKPLLLPARHLLTFALLGAAAWFAAQAGWSATHQEAQCALYTLAALAGILGIMVVLPIGGADMPVVVSLLNSYSGLAASMAGFVIGNSLLITAGALVGAAGLILTQLMCRAMNRSLLHVLVGGFGDGDGGGDTSGYENVKSAGPEEAAMVLEAAEKVIFIPGYGMAVAQAQHVVKQLAQELESRNVEIRYAIHPVAGRMPGHMNVLLAEADVPYEQLFEMERINGDFRDTDVAMVIGANDVVNPAAIEDSSSPIAGMPILHAFEARTVLMVKRSLSPGYAGIKNPLFERENCLMCFGDGKEFLAEVLAELKKN